MIEEPQLDSHMDWPHFAGRHQTTTTTTSATDSRQRTSNMSESSARTHADANADAAASTVDMPAAFIHKSYNGQTAVSAPSPVSQPTRLLSLGIALLLLLPLGVAGSARNTPAAALKSPQAWSQSSGSGSGSGGFRPVIPQHMRPEDIAGNVFTAQGQYRVFEGAGSDLRANVRSSESRTALAAQNTTSTNAMLRREELPAEPTGEQSELGAELRGIEELLVEYVENFFSKGQYEPMPGLIVALQRNHTNSTATGKAGKRLIRRALAESYVSLNVPRALQSGRLLFFTGLKKVMWPIYMGLQLLKSLLLAMLLPTIISSVGKLLGKGIISGSAPIFVRPMEAPQELDFRDNSFNFDDDQKFGMAEPNGGTEGAYSYHQPEAAPSQNQYAYSAGGMNEQTLSRYGMTEQQLAMQDSYLSALQSIGAASFKNSNSLSSGGGGLGGGGGGGGGAPGRTKPAPAANMNTFQTFQKVPASSLLLSNYDPFYSPLLSRLDSVFAQLKLNSENEACREKLICLMYAHPAKYAPYSNLVSAQLSRELNELRKPTTDNPDILRFFKYMRAAKDGQDGVDCEKTFDKCSEFKDFENPAMVSTYHDINKLVQARKLT